MLAFCQIHSCAFVAQASAAAVIINNHLLVNKELGPVGNDCQQKIESTKKCRW
jgi:hypothetical protein